MQARIKIFFSGKIFPVLAKNVLKNENYMKKTQLNLPPPESDADILRNIIFGEGLFLRRRALTCPDLWRGLPK